jgi:hypothetical protein
MMGVLMPLFIVHTIIGGIQFFKAPLITCRGPYQGEVFYIILFMFAVSMCFVFVLLLLCVLMPTWIKNFRRKRRTAGLGNRIQQIDGLIDPSDFEENLLDNEAPERPRGAA